MKRKIEQDLIQWKNSSNRKPLILSGARQVGKTYALKALGSASFQNLHYINFEKDKKVSSIFKTDYDTERILSELELALGKKISVGHDLLVFDEIQQCPEALTSLKYFQEELPDLHLASAGSLLGVSLNEQSFPVGKVDRLWLGPLSFTEYLDGTDSEMELEHLKEVIIQKKVTPFVHQVLLEKFRIYQVLGGMPAVINTFKENKANLLEGFREARKIQLSLIQDYLEDISKHAGKINALHIREVLENVPVQLGQNLDEGVKKYVFKDVLATGRGYAELQGPLSWLERAGLIYKIKICNKAELPLEAFCKDNVFKIYFFDIGLLGALMNLPPELLYQDNYGQTKGVFFENTCLQLFKSSASVNPIYSWQHNTSELEFLKVIGNDPIPIEAKAGDNTKAKSLLSYTKKYHPKFRIIIYTKPLDHDKESHSWRIPIYLAEDLEKVVV